MKKKIFFAAMAIALASCASDDFVGENNNSPNPEKASDAIVFNSGAYAITRADKEGPVAAAALNNKFVVGGFKGTTSVATTTVFDNYNVEYRDNTANTTESNTSNWEYVGLQPNSLASIPHEATDVQTIKYWDYSASQYDFIAYSLGTGGATATTITPSTATSKTGGAYTLEGTTAQLSTVHIADLVTVLNDDFNKVVKFSFRNMVSKVRVALYETVPGYSVNNVKFYVEDKPAGTGDGKTTPTTTAALFASSSVLPTSGKFTVYFPTVNSATPETDKNKAHIDFTTKTAQQSYQTFSELAYGANKENNEAAGAIYLGRTSNTSTYATGEDANHYVNVLPLEDGTHSLTLKVDYTLISTDGSAETIDVVGAKAVVPAIYAQWKPGYAYTYLFKISDNTNGFTSKVEGDKLSGLHPITFDAVVVQAEDKVQETITTVATPSITTYQPIPANTTPATIVTANDEYKEGKVYAMVMDGGTLKGDLNGTTSPVKDAAKLYYLGTSAVSSLGTDGVTEAEVMDALLMQTSATSSAITGRNGLTLTVQSSINNTIEAIPGADGNDITITAGQASELTLSKDADGNTNYYAYVYTAAQPGAATVMYDYEPATVSVGADVTSYYITEDGKTFTLATGTAVAGKTYYTQITYNKYTATYAIKVIKVVP